MKKRSFVLLIAVCFAALSIGGCAKKAPQAVIEEVLFSGETYNEMLLLSAQGTMFGAIDLCDDAKYVTHGTRSAKFTFDRTYGYYPDADQGRYSSTAYWSIKAENMPEHLMWLDRWGYLSLDVYNASAEEFGFYVCVTDGDGKYVFADGTRLAANGYSPVRFDLKPWFYEKNEAIGEVKFMLRGLENAAGGKAELYVDNIRIGLSDNSLPVRETRADVSKGGIELLKFDEYNDCKWIVPEMKQQNLLSPICSVLYDSGERALAVTTDNCYVQGVSAGNPQFQGELWGDTGEIAFVVHSSIAKNAEGAMGISVVCNNPGNVDRDVSLCVEGSKNVNVRKRIRAYSAEKIVLQDAEALKQIDKMYISLDVWRNTAVSTLYFSDLTYSLSGGNA